MAGMGNVSNYGMASRVFAPGFDSAVKGNRGDNLTSEVRALVAGSGLSEKDQRELITELHHLAESRIRIPDEVRGLIDNVEGAHDPQRGSYQFQMAKAYVDHRLKQAARADQRNATQHMQGRILDFT